MCITAFHIRKFTIFVFVNHKAFFSFSLSKQSNGNESDSQSDFFPISLFMLFVSAVVICKFTEFVVGSMEKYIHFIHLYFACSIYISSPLHYTTPTKKPTIKMEPKKRKVCAERISCEPMNNMNIETIVVFRTIFFFCVCCFNSGCGVDNSKFMEAGESKSG